MPAIIQVQHMLANLRINLREFQPSESFGKGLLGQTEETKSNFELFKYNATCLGGTFDHLHLGHKLLLTCALLLSKKRMLIGVTGQALLLKKKYAHFLEAFEIRKNRVQDFLTKLNPDVAVELFELVDPVGPVGNDTSLQACILTREVEKGGQMINTARTKNDLPPLDLVFIDMILAEENVADPKSFSNKTSSSYIRQYLDRKFNLPAEDSLASHWNRMYELIGAEASRSSYWLSRVRDSYC